MNNRSVWECQNCGAQFPKWSGQCPDCHAWNTLVETAVSPKLKTKTQISKPQLLSEVLKQQDKSLQRVSTGIGELDRVLGGGLVPGQVVLLAGEPGMGKSTLLSQVSLAITAKSKIKNQKSKINVVLYICGEESPSQIGLRLRRLSASPLSVNYSLLSLYPETDVDAVSGQIENSKPGLVIIDSIQTQSTADLSGLAGSVGQIRECTARLSLVAKALNIPLFLVGHVTKEGEVAGPKVLEHMVDTVLVMEGDRSGNLRILRSLKNRFGPVDEVGIFSMDDTGMAEVKNPAQLLVGDLAAQAPGSVLGCVLEGQRPLVLEIQALAVPSKLSFPRRVGAGISERRLQLLCAVIEKHLGLGIGEKDVFVNVAGGLKTSDPGLDLPVVAAIVSSARKTIDDRRLKVVVEDPPSPSSILNHPSSTPIFCGEIGLLGEVRMVPGWPRREKEVKRLRMGKLVGKTEIKHIGQLQRFLQ